MKKTAIRLLQKSGVQMLKSIIKKFVREFSLTSKWNEFIEKEHPKEIAKDDTEDIFR